MGVKILALLVAALSGLSMAVQGSLNAVLGKFTGLLEATFIVHIVGVSIVSMLMVIGIGQGKLGALAGAPWYTFLGGAIGVLIVYGVAFSIPKIGVANATTAIVVAQVGSAMLIDQFGLFGLRQVPFAWTKILGLALLAGGAYFMLANCRG